MTQKVGKLWLRTIKNIEIKIYQAILWVLSFSLVLNWLQFSFATIEGTSMLFVSDENVIAFDLFDISVKVTTGFDASLKVTTGFDASSGVEMIFDLLLS